MILRTSVTRFEHTLIGMSGGIDLYRKGIDEFYLSHGFPGAYEEVEILRSKLEKLGMYQHCRQALLEAERLVRQGAEFDEQAYDHLSNAAEALMKASGTWESMARRFRPANDPSSEG